VYLNLVLEFVPETIYRASRHYAKLRQAVPMLLVKVHFFFGKKSFNGHYFDLFYLFISPYFYL